ncbi:MAG: GNAT family N-acetyltransferase [Pirellula sp.]|jgi:GNAT superfamily N-acetyltransferase|nr:GNAT family N-acetyltransferase [Pirellula sp.]
MTITCESYRYARVIPEDLYEIGDICRFRAMVWHATLQQTGHVFANSEIRDEWDASATHWVVRDVQEQIAACGRLIVAREWTGIPEPSEYIGKGIPEVQGLIAAPDRIVVRPDCQKGGLASRLLELQEQEAERLGAGIAVRQASPGMLRCIAKRGWIPVGPASPDPKFPDVAFTVAYKLLRPLTGECP